MRLNCSTDYAIRILIYLAKEASVVSSAKLSEKVGVSPRYLLQIGAKLRKAELITTTYGPSGGFSIKRPANGISLYDIILSMEGAVRTGEICGTPTDVMAQEILALGEEYRKIEKMLEKALKVVTLENILQNNQ